LDHTSFITEGWLLCRAIVTVVEVSSPEVGANVGHLFSNATGQEQGNTIVNGKRPLSFEALFPFRYNDFQTKVMKVVASSSQYENMNINVNMNKNVRGH
jgi:hypothetical protein